MLKPWIPVALLAVVLTAAPSFAGEVDREILVPAGWEGAYQFGYAPLVKVGDMVIVSGVPNGGPGTYRFLIVSGHDPQRRRR